MPEIKENSESKLEGKEKPSPQKSTSSELKSANSSELEDPERASQKEAEKDSGNDNKTESKNPENNSDEKTKEGAPETKELPRNQELPPEKTEPEQKNQEKERNAEPRTESVKDLDNNKELEDTKKPDNTKELEDGKKPDNTKELEDTKKPDNTKELEDTKKPDNTKELENEEQPSPNFGDGPISEYDPNKSDLQNAKDDLKYAKDQKAEYKRAVDAGEIKKDPEIEKQLDYSIDDAKKHLDDIKNGQAYSYDKPSEYWNSPEGRQISGEAFGELAKQATKIPSKLLDAELAPADKQKIEDSAQNLGRFFGENYGNKAIGKVADASKDLMQGVNDTYSTPADKFRQQYFMRDANGNPITAEEGRHIAFSDKDINNDGLNGKENLSNSNADIKATEKNTPLDNKPEKIESEVSSPFSSDNFKPEKSFNAEANEKYPGLNELKNKNVYDVKPMGTKVSDAERAPKGKYTPEERDRLKDIREKIDAPNSKTVMQKVISADTGNINEDLKNYLNPQAQGNNKPKAQIYGFVSKANDAAPFTKTPQECYNNLRLDYKNTPYNNPEQPVYVIRFTDGKNYEIPYSKEFNGKESGLSPFSGNGFVSAKDVTIPEYTVLKDKKGSGAVVTGGEIYRVNPNGTEEAVAYFDKKQKCFKPYE